MRKLWGLVIAVAIAVGVSGCPFLDEDPPGRKCRGNPDCFGAQGEKCDVANGVCIPAADAGGID